MKNFELLIGIFILIGLFSIFFIGNNSDEEIIVLDDIESKIIPDVPKDAIPPLFFPDYVTIEETIFSDDEFVLGFENNGESRAYPLNIMNFHEIVNDEIGGKKIVVTYCPLCRSGIVFSAELDDQELSFGNTGSLYESAMVMYDRETNSYWAQIGGEALIGPLKGKILEHLPANIMTLGEWKEQYPDTLILSTDLGYLRDYTYNPFESYDRTQLIPRFGISNEDNRTLPKDKIIGVKVGEIFKAYSLTQFGKNVVNDDFEDKHFVIFSTETNSGFIYERDIDGRILTFELADDVIIDKETNSEWLLSGKAISGELIGEKLDPYPSVASYWFGWSTIHPETFIYE